MKKNFFLLLTALLALSLATVSCSSGGGNDNGNNNNSPQTVRVTGVVLNKTSTSLTVGSSETLTATVQPPNATIKTVNWSSSNSGIASVNTTTGLVTGISVGSARITATTNDGSYTAHCDVAVTGTNPPPGGSGDVYVAGAEWFYDNGLITVPTVWKNGVPKGYGKGYFAKVFVSGNDVYVIIDNPDDGLVTIYKNDVQYQQIQVKLSNLSPHRRLSFFVSGNDVYVCACVPTGSNYPDFKPMLWKNGVQQNLSYNSQNNAYANSIFVSGSDVYVVGYEQNYDGSKVILWKNGTPQYLSADFEATRWYRVFVSGVDVYVAGWGIIWTPGSQGDFGVLWKNNVPQRFNDRWFDSLYVSGSDVYLVGYDKDGDALWKNNVKQRLDRPNPDTWVRLSSVFVAGNDVYATGYSTSIGGAYLWKNGEIQRLNRTENSNGIEVYSLAVK